MCSQPSSKLAVLHVQSHHLDTATLQQLCCVSNKNVASSHGRKMAMVAQALACPTCLRVTRYGGANGGNGLRQADSKIQDKAIEREVEAQDNTEAFQSRTRTVDDHSTESVGGIKKIEALGALKLLSGGSASLAAVDDLHQATGRDLNLVVGQKLNATVGGDQQEQIQGLRKSVAGASQRLQAPKTWLGSDGVNVLQLFCDLLDIVEQMNTNMAEHTYGPSPIPSNAGEFTGAGAITKWLSAKLKPITL
ncbi:MULTISPECIES: hypothetical protein [unclassified Pseudomonas]|uniref:hypothetical protein n=1 Tax=Pseudomonas sp. VE 267-6A TaxID=2956729 RepID=UPI002096ED14|nr:MULTISPECIES: hypothetical protein [unclassified Pseudomonas]MCO7503786.1 hypothetical protein [Pseudomonas sp. VE 267-6A]MCO7530207.1 hypothetical protein [Pseudomonas sp. 2]